MIDPSKMRGPMLLLLAILALAGPAAAKPMKLMEMSPKVDQLMSGPGTSLALRFDGPVDHRGARLTLTGPQGTRSLKARLKSRPDTIYTSLGNIAAGAYRLAWQVRAPDGEISSGETSFTVKQRP
jgi:methionine-rich copper-binding protein CopC